MWVSCSSCLPFIAFQVACLFLAPVYNVTEPALSFCVSTWTPPVFLLLLSARRLQWHPVLRTLKNRIEENTGHTFNSLLCNLYRNEKDSVDWHSDDEPSLGRYPVIASLSFGATRTFEMRKKPPPVSILLCIYVLPPSRYSVKEVELLLSDFKDRSM